MMLSLSFFHNLNGMDMNNSFAFKLKESLGISGCPGEQLTHQNLWFLREKGSFGYSRCALSPDIHGYD